MAKGLRITGAILLALVTASPRAEGWQPVEGPIMTRWAARVNPKQPLPEYPRPQMVRKEWTNLNGLWDYAIQLSDGPAPERFDGEILVPYPVESALSGVRRMLAPTNRLWYHRTFQFPEFPKRERVLLHFGAVDWETKVWVNGQVVGEHRGGYDPFSFDITRSLKPGAKNELLVKVYDPGTSTWQPDGKQNYRKFTQPGGIAYTASSGIWQTAWLEKVPENYIKDLKITPDVDAGVVRLQVLPSGASPRDHVTVTVLDGSRTVAQSRGQPGEELEVPVKNARLWTPDAPFLYTLKIAMGDDTVTSYFGMRKVSVGKDEHGLTRILLNGKFIFQSGPLDQGFWPDGLYTAPTDEALRFDIAEMKRLGFNMVRKHLKVEPERWYYWCDKLGLLVWQDMPCADGGTAAGMDRDGVVKLPEAAQVFASELKAMIETHRNHPSVIMWIIFNENWGQYETPRITKWVKELDPSRLVNSASGWFDARVGEVIDQHNYPAPTRPAPEATRAAVLGEFGGLGMTIPGHSWSEEYAQTYRGMSGERALTRRYLDYWRQVWQFKNIGLSAAVYTQLTDVENECNGLLTYDRKQLKMDAKLIAAAHLGHFGPPPVFTDVVATAQSQPIAWRYATEQPTEDWFKLGFDDSRWLVGQAGFGSDNFTNAIVRTPWSDTDIWLRQQVFLPKRRLNHPALRVFHGQDVEVYFNGVLAAKLGGQSVGFEECDIRPEAVKTLKPGLNHIAAHCRTDGPARYFDLGLVDEQTQ